MAKLPTMRQLEAAGSDAGPLLDGYIRELEMALPMAIDAKSRTAIRRALRRAEKRWTEFFGKDEAE